MTETSPCGEGPKGIRSCRMCRILVSFCAWCRLQKGERVDHRNDRKLITRLDVVGAELVEKIPTLALGLKLASAPGLPAPRPSRMRTSARTCPWLPP